MRSSFGSSKFSTYVDEKEYPRDRFQLDVREFNVKEGGRNVRYVGLFYRLRKFKGETGRTLTSRDLRYGGKKGKTYNSHNWFPVLDRQGYHICRRMYA